MSEGPPPISSSSNPNKTMLRNILTGVITTVIGGGLIWFLGFHSSGSGSSTPDYLVVKDATMNSWRSYVSVENVFFGNWNVDVANYSNTGFDHYKESTLGELQRFKSDITKILETKNLDPSFISLLERRLQAKDDWEKKYRKHLDNYETIDRSTPDQAEKVQKLNTEVQRFANETKDIDQRFANEIGELCNTLTSKYGYTFSWKDLKMYQQLNSGQTNTNGTTTTGTTGTNGNNTGTSTTADWQKLIGKWQMQDKGTTVGTLYEYRDGRMYYYFQSGDSTYGRWQYNNNQLTLYYDQFWGAGQNFVYTISNLTDNTFTMSLATPPNSVFTATRSN
jgi:hypothetical protein